MSTGSDSLYTLLLGYTIQYIAVLYIHVYKHNIDLDAVLCSVPVCEKPDNPRKSALSRLLAYKPGYSRFSYSETIFLVAKAIPRNDWHNLFPLICFEVANFSKMFVKIIWNRGWVKFFLSLLKSSCRKIVVVSFSSITNVNADRKVCRNYFWTFLELLWIVDYENFS